MCVLIQVIDDRNGCESIYTKGGIVQPSALDSGPHVTWRHSPLLSGMRCEYAYVWSLGKSLSDACPPALSDGFESVASSLRAHMISISKARVCLLSNCFFDLIPESLMREYFEFKNRISESVLGSPKPQNYEFLKEVHIMLEEISQQDLDIDPSKLNATRHHTRTRDFLNKLPRLENRVCYNMFGSKTGRLTTKRGTFPVLNLAREHRSVLVPENDALVEFDYNSAEVRTFLSLSGVRDVPGDIHTWNVQNVAKNTLSREEMKQRFFAWLYNPDSTDSLLQEHYNKDSIKEEFWNGEVVENPFGRIIESDEHHSLNYLIQSTTNDIVLERCLEMRKTLMGRKSKIKFTLHDSVVLDFAKEDRDLLAPLVQQYGSTKLGHFKVNVKMGKDFGNMRDIKVT